MNSQVKEPGSPTGKTVKSGSPAVIPGSGLPPTQVVDSAVTAHQKSGELTSLLAKMTEASSGRKTMDMTKLKQTIKAQNSVINSLLEKIDQLKRSSSQTKSVPVKLVIEAAIEAAEMLDSNHKVLHSAFLETEKMAKSFSKPSND